MAELSIGDWVRNPATGSHYKITATFLNPMGEMLTAQVDGGGKDIRCFSENIEPIPLTPETLEKNGISKTYESDEYAVYKGEGFNVTEYYTELWEFEIRRNRLMIRNVHQLQHAMRLAGIEKEIEL